MRSPCNSNSNNSCVCAKDDATDDTDTDDDDISNDDNMDNTIQYNTIPSMRMRIRDMANMYVTYISRTNLVR